MSFDVFVSYPSQEQQTADAVCASLEKAGLTCWIAPRDIVPGADWGAAIVGAISEAKLMVLVFSQHANASEQIKREVERAVHYGIPIIPFRIENITMSKSLQYFLSTPHWLDAMSPPLQAHLDRLVRSVKSLLSTSTEKPAKDAGLAVMLGQFFYACAVAPPNQNDLTQCKSAARTLGVETELNELLSELRTGKRTLQLDDTGRIQELLRTRHGPRVSDGYYLGFRIKLLNSIIVSDPSGGDRQLLSSVGSQVLRAMKDFDAPVELQDSLARNLVRATDKSRGLPGDDLVRFCDLLLIDLQNLGVTDISLMRLRQFLTGGLTVGDPGFMAAASASGY
jgi:TIR domain